MRDPKPILTLQDLRERIEALRQFVDEKLQSAQQIQREIERKRRLSR